MINKKQLQGLLAGSSVIQVSYLGLHASTDTGEYAGKRAKHPLLLWSEVPDEYRYEARSNQCVEEDCRCNAAAPNNFGAKLRPGKYPRCRNQAKESGLCYLHEKALAEVGQVTWEESGLQKTQ
jgi:hypothetical protein